MSTRYQNATARKYSTGLKVVEYRISASPNNSVTPMKKIKDEVFIMLLNSLPSGGTMNLVACGSTIRRIALR